MNTEAKISLVVLFGFVLMLTYNCTNKSSGKVESFIEQIKLLKATKLIDNSLYFRLCIYDKLVNEKKRNNEIYDKSIYQIIDGLDSHIRKTGNLNIRDTRHKDYEIVLTKSVVLDSMLYSFKYVNRTNEIMTRMSIAIYLYDALGTFSSIHKWVCKGANCLDMFEYKIPLKELKIRETKITNSDLIKFELDSLDEYKNSRFDINLLEVEYENKRVVEYKF